MPSITSYHPYPQAIQLAIVPIIYLIVVVVLLLDTSENRYMEYKKKRK